MEEKTTPYSLDLPTDLRYNLESQAKEQGRTLASHIRLILAGSINQQEDK